MKINPSIKPPDLIRKLDQLWEHSARKLRAIEAEYDSSKGSPVFTVKGKYTTRGWTEWTQGFQIGSAILQYDATREKEFLDLGLEQTLAVMAPHVSHVGVHDHGFNNVSTYGNLLRLQREGSVPPDPWLAHFCEIALKVSGAVQASRWTAIADGGFIYSFNGPHSLFVDTIRSCRALVISHCLGHVLMTENDRAVSLLQRAVEHARATATYSIYYGEGRDSYDEWGRTAHESVFNTNDGNYRCPNAQQGYSGFTTWTRGLAWAMCGYSELLEFMDTVEDVELTALGGRDAITGWMEKAARATCDFYIANTPTDGIPFWDAGAPGLVHMGDYLHHPSHPSNAHEPIDSSAAAIAAQGLLRLGRYFEITDEAAHGRYWQAGLTVLDHLFEEPYLSTDARHHGLILHSIYHRPNGWDHIPVEGLVPHGESSMWGDYHAREVALYLQRIIKGEPYSTFFGGVNRTDRH